MLKGINKNLEYENHTGYTASNTAFKFTDLKYQATYKKSQLKKRYSPIWNTGIPLREVTYSEQTKHWN